MAFDIPRSRALLSACHGKLAYDIGARGGTPAFLAERFDSVWAFEPDDQAYAELTAKNVHGVSTFHEALGGGKQSVDSYASKSPPDLIKIDTEGAEVEILEGANRTLRLHPTLYVEYHSEQNRGKCRQILRFHDYEILEVPRQEGHGWLFAQRRIPFASKAKFHLRRLGSRAVRRRR